MKIKSDVSGRLILAPFSALVQCAYINTLKNPVLPVPDNPCPEDGGLSPGTDVTKLGVPGSTRFPKTLLCVSPMCEKEKTVGSIYTGAALAQEVERLAGNHKVAGSIPGSS